MKQFFRLTFLLICLILPLIAMAQDGIIEGDPINPDAEFEPIDDEVINMPDAKLRTAIETALGKAADTPITIDEMADLTRLDARNAGISDLTGLEDATNLTYLKLSDNSISDISPVAGLINLTHLDLDGNALSDISAVAGLTNLTFLDIWGASISDISPVTGLTNLTTLGLGGNNISNISPVAGLTNLTGLYLPNNHITDISFLSDLTNLKTLWLQDNNITDLSPLVANAGLGSGDEVDVQGNPLNRASIETRIPALQGRGVTVEFDIPLEEPVHIPDSELRKAIESALGEASGAPIAPSDMANLTRLDAREAGISDLTGLEGATNLTRLELRDNSITDLSPLAGLTNLMLLDLQGNTISDISALAALTSLTWLNLWYNTLSDISALAGLTNLTELGFGGNTISDISVLEGLTQLERLELWNNSITDLSPIADLTNLTFLGAASNRSISDVSVLKGLTNLTELFLNGNSISDISPLAGLTNLTRLSLSNNSISDISALAGLTNLTLLRLDRNSISDISALVNLTNLTRLELYVNRISDPVPVAGLTNLTRLNLAENSISDISDLAGLTNLTYLELPFNSISDLSPLVANMGVGSGDEVDVRGNPLNRASIKDHIPALQGRGVTVEFDNVITELVTIPDMALRDAIAAALDKASGAPITKADMAKLTELTAPNANISNLTGLEAATNLTRLNLGTERQEDGRSINSNSVSDLSPLAGLTNLTWLRLRNNSISDISPLAGLTNLTYLNLGGNLMISDISPLSGLTNLETLWLYANSISNLSPLAGLTNLRLLSLWFNSVSDISPLAGLTNLRHLWLSNSSYALPQTGFLTDSSFNNNSISDLSPLVANTGLGAGDTVEVWGNPLSDASIQTHIPALQSRGVTVDTPTLLLKLSGTVTEADNRLIVEVRDSSNRLLDGVTVTFTVISGSGTLSVTNATTDADGRAESRLTLGPDTGTNTVQASVEGISEPVTFSDVPEPPVDIPDSDLRAVIEQALDKASGATITPSDMARLRRLDARNANISNLTGLEGATNLTRLDLGAEFVEAELRVINSNSVSDLSPVAGLINLTNLTLGGNNISDISSLSGLTNLTWLSLGDNDISDISPLSGLTNLGGLSLGDNDISDISAVAGLTNLTWLSLDNNNISNISAVAGLTNLTWLSLNDNSITDISPLAGLTRLRWCLLGNNSITDISPLVANTGLGSEDTVDVRGNPLSYLSLHTHTLALQRKGVTVEFDRPVETLSGHTDGVVSVAFSPEGSILASGSIDHTVQLWDTVTELPIATLIGHTATARSVAFSPDGSILASGSHDNTVRLWNVETRQLKAELTGHTAGVESVAFSPDGSTLASGGHDGTVRLWDTVTGQPINIFMEGSNTVWSVAYSPDGNTLAIGLNNGAIVLARALGIHSAAHLPKILEGHTGFVESVAFSPDGSTLASGSYDSTVRLWDTVTGQPIYTLTGHTEGINSVAFSPDGTILASGSDDSTIWLWDPLTGDPIDTLTGHTAWVRSVAFNRDGSILASGSGDSTVRLWELAPPPLPEYVLFIPADISLIHVPLKVATVNGVEKTIESVGDLYDALGGADTVRFLTTRDSQAQEWHSYVGTSSTGTPADQELTDDMGIIASMKTPVSVHLTGAALGTNGSSSITLNPGHNLVGLPLKDERINRVSDLLRLDGIWGNVSVITLNDGGKFKTVGRAGDPGDIEITGGQAFILLDARQTATVEISGEAWTNVSESAAAPPVAFQGIKVGAATPVLGLSGSIVGEAAGLKGEGFRVTVKNLSTGRAVTDLTKDEGTGYRFTIVDIETARAATIGDILEISAQSPHPFIGVEPLRYTVTAEDVKRSQIQLPKLVVYEIPTETELLRNYPNPFNPETWIPYRLAEDAFVTLTIYDGSGYVVRTLDVGHRIAAVYESRSKAIYWDGRNEFGERVASGLYFYHLSAGDYSATRRMLILK